MPYQVAWRSTPRQLISWIDFGERVKMQEYALFAEMVFVGSQGDKKAVGKATKQIRELI